MSSEDCSLFFLGVGIIYLKPKIMQDMGGGGIC